MRYDDDANRPETDVTYCLLGIIVNRGKAEKVFRLARKLGLHHANCVLAQGRSAAPNRFLDLLALGEVEKEIILLGIKKSDEEMVLALLEKKLGICRPHKGIAFTIPIISPGTPMVSFAPESPYRCVMTILNEEVVDDFVDFIRKNGYLGLTTIKARGGASIMHPLMEMHVESAKELMLMIVHRDKTERLIGLVKEHFNLSAENTGVLAVLPINRITGIMFEREELEGEEGRVLLPLPVAKHLVVSLVPHGTAEEYLHNMKRFGVSGSTILHSRLSDLLAKGEGLFPFHVDTEEDMVLTLAGHALAEEVRQRLPLIEFENHVRKPYALSLPVIHTEGVRLEGDNV